MNMQRVKSLIGKITELSGKDKLDLIEIDLLMDYTRVLYADLSEMRGKQPVQLGIKNEPTLEELTNAMQEDEEEPGEPVMPTPAITFINEEEPGDEPEAERVKRDDIRRHIGINDKYQILSELFNNDSAAYETMLEGINASSDFRQALEWIDEHGYKKYSWNDEHEAVQILYGIVSNYFSGTGR